MGPPSRFAGTRTKKVPASPNAIFQSLILPSGRRVQNRLVKVAMYEHLAAFGGGPPNAYHLNLYLQWAKHGWGMIITGNVAVSDNHLTLGRDLVLPKSSEVSAENAMLPFKRLAEAMHGIDSNVDNTPVIANKTLAIMQLNHSGRQSSNFLGGRMPFQAPMAPSAIRVTPSDSSLISRAANALMFQVPKAMTHTDIQRVIDRFVEGAVLAYRTGFDGVQLHAAHGYLLAQFLSPKSNKRQDIYSVNNSLDILRTIAIYIRESTSSTFVIGVKLNAAEYTSTESSLSDMEQRALNHIMTMATWGLLDFIEISGGDYENPDFMASEIPRSQRQAFFARFSHIALQALESLRNTTPTPPPLILLTGGLKNVDLLNSALTHKHTDLLGIGRASVVCPDLPRIVLEKSKSPRGKDDESFGPEPRLLNDAFFNFTFASWIWTMLPKIKIIGAGFEMAWYVVVMRQIATSKSKATHLTYGRLGAILWMWMWTPSLRTLTKISDRRTFFLLATLLIAVVAYLIHGMYI